MLRKVLPIILIMLIFPALALAAAPNIKGKYTQIPDKQFAFDGKTVEVMEFLSFYCGTCYNFERSIPVIKGNFPKKIKWKIVPLYWGEGSPKPGEAYFLAEEAGRGEQMKKALFHAHFVEKKDIGKIEVLEGIAAQVGLGFDFSRKLRAGDKAGEAKKALELAKAYRIEETPTLIIAGNIMTNPHSFEHDLDGFRDNAITIIKSILK